MKRWIIAVCLIPIPLLIGWIGGLEFERDPMVAFNVCAGLVMALMALTFPELD